MNALCPAVLLLGLALASAPAVAGPLEGRWRLVGQTAGAGDRNHVPQPLILEFARRDGRLAGRLEVGEGPERRIVDWPSPGVDPDLATGARRVLELHVWPAEDRVRVRVRIEPPVPGADPVEILEEYAVAEEGRALVGRVTVAVPGGGSYVLQRRFERIP